MAESDPPDSFRLAYVPGVTPDKWVRIWNERSATPLVLAQVPTAEAEAKVRNRDVDAALLRLPIERTGLHAIPLYTETTVVMAPKDHLVAAAEEVTAEDLADDVVWHPLDDTLDWDHPPGRPATERPATTADAVQLVAAGVGLLIVPQSLARLHHRKDLTYRPVSDVPQSRVALSWVEDKTTELMELFIGVVRGRTVNSTRGQQHNQDTTPANQNRKDPAGRKPASSNQSGGNRKAKPGRPKRDNHPRRRRRS